MLIHQLNFQFKKIPIQNLEFFHLISVFIPTRIQCVSVPFLFQVKEPEVEGSCGFIHAMIFRIKRLIKPAVTRQPVSHQSSLSQLVHTCITMLCCMCEHLLQKCNTLTYVVIPLLSSHMAQRICVNFVQIVLLMIKVAHYLNMSLGISYLTLCSHVCGPLCLYFSTNALLEFPVHYMYLGTCVWFVWGEMMRFQ